MPIPEHVKTKKLLLVDREKFRKLMPLSAATDEQVDIALATIDQGAEYDAARPSWLVEEWDRQSPINDAPADQMLQDIPEGGGVYVFRDAAWKIVVFQPFKPGVPGFQPIKDPIAEGTIHADEIAADYAAVRVARLVQERITAAG